MYAEHTHTRIYVSTNFWERFFHMDHRTKVKKSPSYASSWICFLLDVEVRYGIQNRGSYVPLGSYLFFYCSVCNKQAVACLSPISMVYQDYYTLLMVPITMYVLCDHDVP
jgi:hypothetical protein